MKLYFFINADIALLLREQAPYTRYIGLTKAVDG